MLIKLLKYEFKATARVFVFLYCLFAGLTGLIVVSAGLSGFSEVARQILAVLVFVGALAFFPVVFGLVCLMVATVLIRFGKNILGDEGYITHTLPVSAEKLIISKVIVSVFWTLATCLWLGLCICVIAFDFTLLSVDNISFMEIADAILRCISFSNVAEFIKQCVFLLAIQIVWFVKIYLIIYASMAVGYSFNGFRRAKSLGIFIVANYILSYVSSAVYKAFDITYGAVNFNFSPDWCVYFAYNIVVAAVMFFITAWFLKHRLNLQ